MLRPFPPPVIHTSETRRTSYRVFSVLLMLVCLATSSREKWLGQFFVPFFFFFFFWECFARGTNNKPLNPAVVGCTHVMHGGSRMTTDPRIPTMPERKTSGFHRPGRHCLHQARSAVRSHEVRAATYREPLLRRTFLHMDDSVE